MRFLRKIWITGAIICLVSCENIMYHSYSHIPFTGWLKGDTIYLNLSVNDSIGGFYRLDFLIRNQTNYPYQDLSLSVTKNFPDSSVWSTDTLSFRIADDKGNWLGKGISGLYESVLRLDSADIFIIQSYQFKVIPIIDDSILTGINDVGIIARKLGGNLNSPPPPRIYTEEDEQQNGESPEG